MLAGEIPPESAEVMRRELRDDYLLEEEDVEELIAYFCRSGGLVLVAG